MTDPFIIAAMSGRAMAQSAHSAGMNAVVVDGFLDSDTRRMSCDTRRLKLDGRGICKYSLQKQLETLPESLAHGGLVFGSGLENAIDVIDAWSCNYPVYGNSVEVLRCVNNARQFFSLLEALDIRFPQTQFFEPKKTDAKWLVKQQYCAGGAHIKHYHADMDGLSSESYFQRFVIGIPVSLLFLADGYDIFEVGFNTQWITSSGEHPFSYRGAVNRTMLSSRQKDEVRNYAERLTKSLRLRGMNTLDCMLTPNGITVLELNPRPGASLSLYDEEIANGLLSCHIRACLGQLPVMQGLQNYKLRASEIISAASDVIIHDDFDWPDCSADRPMPGTMISSGTAICTIYAEADNLPAVQKKLKSTKACISSRLMQTQEAA